jgi:hypothetical protein
MKAGTAIVLASEVLRECHRVRWALYHRRCRTDPVAAVGQNQTRVDIRAEERRGSPPCAATQRTARLLPQPQL